MNRAALLAGIAACACLPALAHADEAACAALAGSDAFADTVIESAVWVASVSGEGPAADLPGFCEATGIISPVADSRIGVVYRLPENWNGRVLGLGGGGLSGNISLFAAAGGLARSYATMQTDTGHEGQGMESHWLLDDDNEPRWEALVDFAHRSLHLMTVIGKEVAQAHYGRAHDLAFYQGCSTGGRQGMMEAQRFPEDYDAIIAGAPVFDMTVQAGGMVRGNLFSRDPQARFTPALLGLLNEAALARCDARDGVTDGVISDPLSCDFDPVVLACPEDAPGADCLNPAQIEAARTVYRGVRTAHGAPIAEPAMPGAERNWSFAIGAGPGGPEGDPDAIAVFTGQYGFDVAGATDGEIAAAVFGSPFAAEYAADSTEISAFLERGGRLLLYHGLLDTVAWPAATIRWYEAMLEHMGAEARDSARLFLMPGTDHCAGGPGANSADWLGAMEQWVETGRAPESIPAMRVASPFGPALDSDLPDLTRPLCAWPFLPVYDGAGDPNAAESFSCRAP